MVPSCEAVEEWQLTARSRQCGETMQQLWKCMWTRRAMTRRRDDLSTVL